MIDYAIPVERFRDTLYMNTEIEVLSKVLAISLQQLIAITKLTIKERDIYPMHWASC